MLIKMRYSGKKSAFHGMPPFPTQRYDDIERDLSENGFVYLEDVDMSEFDMVIPYQKARKEILRANLKFGFGESEDKPIKLFINSYGSFSNECLALYDQIRHMVEIDELFIETIAQGSAYSGGAVVLQAGSTRIATPNSSIMIHGIQVSDFEGNLFDVEKEIKELKKEQHKLYSIWGKAMGISPSKLAKTIEGEDRFYTASEALSAGLIDSIGI